MEELAERIESLLGRCAQRQIVVAGIYDYGRGLERKDQAGRKSDTVAETSSAEAAVQNLKGPEVLFQGLPKPEGRTAVENNRSRGRIEDIGLKPLDFFLESTAVRLGEGARWPKANQHD